MLDGVLLKTGGGGDVGSRLPHCWQNDQPTSLAVLHSGQIIPSGCTGASSSIGILSEWTVPGELDGVVSAGCDEACSMPASEVAHRRQTVEPDLFLASHFGQTIMPIRSNPPHYT